MKERLVIVFIAVILGLLITTAAYFIYQSTQNLPTSQNETPPESVSVVNENNDTNLQPTQSESGLKLTIDTPADESIHDKRTIEVKGKTDPANTIIISSNQEDVIAEPKSDGSFSTTITIDAGINKIITRSIGPKGEEISDIRVVTYSSEEI